MKASRRWMRNVKRSLPKVHTVVTYVDMYTLRGYVYARVTNVHVFVTGEYRVQLVLFANVIINDVRKAMFVWEPDERDRLGIIGTPWNRDEGIFFVATEKRTEGSGMEKKKKKETLGMLGNGIYSGSGNYTCV